MSYNITLWREDVRSAIGVDSDDQDFSDTRVDRLLNRAFWNLTAKIKFPIAEGEFTFDTTASTSTYTPAVSDLDSITRVAVMDSQERFRPLIKIDDWSMFPMRDDVGEGDLSHYSRRGSDLVFYRVPNDTYTVRILYRKTLTDLENEGEDIPIEWHEVILYGAIARGLAQRGDMNRSETYTRKEAIGMNFLETPEDKEVDDRHMSGVRVLRRRYP